MGSSLEQAAFGTTNVDFRPHGGGLGYGGIVEINAGPVRASLSISGDAGGTRDNHGNWSFFGATSVGAFVQVDNPTDPNGKPLVKASFPGMPNATPGHDPQNVWGAFIGAGPHGFATNAPSPYDLKGPFTQYSANGGAIDAAGIQVNLGQSGRRGIYHAALSPDFAPVGAGLGGSGAAYDTTTCIEAAWSPTYGFSGAVC